jgi:hypothetical protein
MKCRDFSSILRTFADVLDVAGAPVARDQIAMLAGIFDAYSASSVSELTKRVAGLPEAAGDPSLGDLAKLLSVLRRFLNQTAKSAVLTDVDAIEKLLHDRASMGFGAFVRMATEAATPTGRGRGRDAPRERDDLVVQYKEKLEAALGDEKTFTAVYNDLRANTAVGKPEITALAKQMTGSGARTQEAALKKIWNRHQSLVVFKAKSRATGGRSAA